MKHFSVYLICILLLLNAGSAAFGQTPTVLRNDVTIRPVFKIENTDTQTRIVYDPTDKSFYTIAWNGELYRLKPETSGNYAIQLIATAEDHAINYLQGLALHDGSLYLLGNVVIKQGVSDYGKAVKAKLTADNKLVWTEIFRTAEHASSKTLYDHAFSAICFSPDGKDIFIASGSRTDHGEVKNNEGLYPNLREIALTSAIFKIPTSTENLICHAANSSFFAGGTEGYADGPAQEVKFEGPYNIVYDKGNLYVADLGNCMVRKIASDGTDR